MCYSCNTKGYFSSRCKDGRGPMVERRTDELEMARPAQNFRPVTPAGPARPVSRLPNHLEARASSSIRSDGSSSRANSRQGISTQAASTQAPSNRPMSSRASSSQDTSSQAFYSQPVSSRASSSQASSSQASSRPQAQTNIQYEPSIMSVESQQSLVNGLMSFRFEIKDMGARIEYLIALRKRLSHKEKKIDDEEYEQAMNTPSMIVLYEAYKQAADHAAACKRAVDQRMRQYSNKFVLAPPEVQMEVYGLQEKWIQATIK
ncbi:hypothetical protein FNAPI_8768 [Fusarium napiforme]|uniref:Uncharacterized protein n=1 Tax=Fusarium napiforme TaxID=42672 RepID=A0A8H5J0R9_9HYPO|nr:hypothetical protein FNAPI_8768 [Fusarium napiforme]